MPACDWSGGRYHKSVRDCILADLAFRLRYELVRHTPYSKRYSYNIAFEMVYDYAKESGGEEFEKANWGLDWSQPIHLIIASLIAKELANDPN